MVVIFVVILLLLSLPIVPRSMVNALCIKILTEKKRGKERERDRENEGTQTRLMFWPHFEFIAFRGYCLSFKTTSTSISSGSDVAATLLLFFCNASASMVLFLCSDALLKSIFIWAHDGL